MFQDDLRFTVDDSLHLKANTCSGANLNDSKAKVEAFCCGNAFMHLSQFGDFNAQTCCNGFDHTTPGKTQHTWCE